MTIGRNLGTIWVCESCMLHHANGECGDCHSDHGHDQEPLSSIENGHTVTLGMGWEDHDDACLTHVIRNLKQEFPELDWPDVPDGYECDCERQSFSRSQCEGCGSYLHGAREAMTLWEDITPPTAVPPTVDGLLALIDGTNPWEV